MLAGAATTLSVLREIFFAFVIPTSAIYISYIVLRITENKILLGGGYIIFIVFIIPIAMRIAGDFGHSIKLTLQNRNLQDKLKTDAANLRDKEKELATRRRQQATLQSQKAHVDEKLRAAHKDRLLLLDAIQEGILVSEM